MNKKNQKNQALLAAIAMLLISAIVITTASFAWFTLGRSAQVEELDLKVTKQGEGIAISANASKFTDTITYANLKGTATDDSATVNKNEADYNASSEYYNYFCERITPASSEFKADVLPAFFQGGIDRVSDTMVATASTSADGKTIFGKKDADGKDVEIPAGCTEAGFYQFDVFIQNGGDTAVNVKMTGSKIIVNAEGDTAEDKGNADFYEETVKAMRIGFVKDDEPVAIFADASSDTAEATKPINGAGEYDVAEDAYTVSTATEYGVPVVNSDSTGTDGIMTLEPGVTKVTVYIWMEGQDTNCTDDLASQYIKTNIVFSIV